MLPSSARDGGADLALRRHLGWAAPAGAALATLAAAAGAAFHDRTTVFGALALIAAVVMSPVLFRRLATRVLERLDSVTGAADAAHVAAKVLDAVRAPFRLGGHEVAVAASVGVSV